MNDGTAQRTRGYLPHKEIERGTYFVTFRLEDSLPQHVQDQITRRRLLFEAARNSGRDLLPAESVALKEISSLKVDNYLDAGSGCCLLRDPRAAEVVVSALKYGKGKRYDLFSWCVMPNHVHVVFRSHEGERLAAILSAWKSFSAHEINQRLGRKGHLWQREYYDRLIRDEAELERAIDYVVNNPMKAGLLNWPWCGAWMKMGPPPRTAALLKARRQP